ncbi:MAG: hypothetical protein ACRD2I_05910 [Vicinamibacterales bacterium]
MDQPSADRSTPPGVKGLANLVEKITPWLFTVGSWMFGGLIAVGMVMISTLLTVGPVDRAVRWSIAAFACALPLNVAGIFLLRLFMDMNEIALDDVTLQAFKDAEFPDIETYFPAPQEKETLRKRRSRVALIYSMGIGALSIVLSLTGLVAALWHMAWWIGLLLLTMTLISTALVMAVMARSQKRVVTR